MGTIFDRGDEGVAVAIMAAAMGACLGMHYFAEQVMGMSVEADGDGGLDDGDADVDEIARAIDEIFGRAKGGDR